MATNDDAPTWDDGSPVSTPGTDDDNEPTYKLDPGEQLIARVRNIEWGAGQSGNALLHLTTKAGDPVKHWSNGTLDEQLNEADVSAEDWIGIEKSEDTASFTNDDGEEVEFHPRNLQTFD
jgi:hypothetical protein